MWDCALCDGSLDVTSDEWQTPAQGGYLSIGVSGGWRQ